MNLSINNMLDVIGAENISKPYNFTISMNSNELKDESDEEFKMYDLVTLFEYDIDFNISPKGDLI